MRKRHYAVEKLSERAQQLVEDGLQANETYESIVERIRKQTGESLAVSSLQRYHARNWFPNRKTLEETNRLHKLVKEQLETTQGKKLDEVSSELLKTLLFDALAAFKDPDPLQLYKLVIAEGRLGVQKDRVEISREMLKAEQDRVKVLQGALKLRERQLSKMEEKGKKLAEKLTRESASGQPKKHTIEQIREMYGLEA